MARTPKTKVPIIAITVAMLCHQISIKFERSEHAVCGLCENSEETVFKNIVVRLCCLFAIFTTELKWAQNERKGKISNSALSPIGSNEKYQSACGNVLATFGAHRRQTGYESSHRLWTRNGLLLRDADRERQLALQETPSRRRKREPQLPQGENERPMSPTPGASTSRGTGLQTPPPLDLGMQLVSRNVGHASVNVKRVQGRLHLRLPHNPMLALQRSGHGVNANVYSANMGSFRRHQLHNGIVDGEMSQVYMYLFSWERHRVELDEKPYPVAREEPVVYSIQGDTPFSVLLVASKSGLVSEREVGTRGRDVGEGDMFRSDGDTNPGELSMNWQYHISYEKFPPSVKNARWLAQGDPSRMLMRIFTAQCREREFHQSGFGIGSESAEG
ncbi:hypothetical protein B0H14DRAFT_2601529 [Mycena olivaceomarginata]|nr:hypothetical protein B0H14DRAFT_2601529 [Mycena olivaceomarginata]